MERAGNDTVRGKEEKLYLKVKIAVVKYVQENSGEAAREFNLKRIHGSKRMKLEQVMETVTDGKRLTYQTDKRNIKKGLEIKYFVPVDTAEMDLSSPQQDDEREGEVVEAGAEPPRVQSVQMTEIKCDTLPAGRTVLISVCDTQVYLCRCECNNQIFANSRTSSQASGLDRADSCGRVHWWSRFAAFTHLWNLLLLQTQDR